MHIVENATHKGADFWDIFSPRKSPSLFLLLATSSPKATLQPHTTIFIWLGEYLEPSGAHQLVFRRPGRINPLNTPSCAHLKDFIAQIPPNITLTRPFIASIPQRARDMWRLAVNVEDFLAIITNCGSFPQGPQKDARSQTSKTS